LRSQLEVAYGPGWLEQVNANLKASGRHPGAGLEDPELCLAVFGFDPAASWAHQSWRSMARVLLDLTDRPGLGRPLMDDDAKRAVAIADSFRAEWGGPGAMEGEDAVVDETEDDDGFAQTKWFALSFHTDGRPDACGDARLNPTVAAPDMVWQRWRGSVVEHLRPHLEAGWTPLEPPGPQHLELEVRWLDRDWKRELLVDAASALTRTFLPGPPQRWEASGVGFRLLLTKSRR